ncbi:hypothetical protein ACFQ4C_30260 [Larkinella insperata]|uniref:T9SS type A sorting domain-containing protein n=1 Tax=Larkinella insperata TaxID=332158 RepID=A0ABW3QCC2_9BACT
MDVRSGPLQPDGHHLQGSGATGMAGNSLTINFQVESQTPLARVSVEAAAGAGCLLVYPNPFLELFTLNSPGNQPLVLYDLSGQKVFALELVQDGQLIAPGEHVSPGF